MKKQEDSKIISETDWTEDNIDAFEMLLMIDGVGGVDYSEKQGNVFLPPYNQVYLMLYSTFLCGLDYNEEYGNYDGACSVSLIAGGGLLLDDEDGIPVTTVAQETELILALTNIEGCKVSTYYSLIGRDEPTCYVSYWCELHLNYDPVATKVNKLSQKAGEIAQVLKAFGAKYPDRYSE